MVVFRSPVRSLGSDYPGPRFTAELDYLSGLAFLRDVWLQDWSVFNARGELYNISANCIIITPNYFLSLSLK